MDSTRIIYETLMATDYFTFKQFTIHHDKSSFRVGTDGVLLGASADLGNVRSILDVGAGTGLISIMLAQRCNAEIVAIEPDYESYIQCKENVNLSGWKERIRVENSSLQDYFTNDKFDLVVSNPPWFSDSLKNPDPRKSSSRHNDSLSNAELLENTARLIADTGRLQLIMPYAEGTVFIAEANGYGFFCNTIVKIRPLPTSEIKRLIMTFSRQPLKAIERFLTIEKGKRHEFTDEYISLTKDFYLKF